jgi:excinuclease UvrABC nuclease subunit
LPLDEAGVLRWAQTVSLALASPREQVARLPLGPGVYRFRDMAGRVLYIGRAVCLRRRVASYWGDLGDRPHLAAMVSRIARAEAVPCDSAHEAAWLERNLLQRRKPPWNRSASGGQESEVWIRLTAAGLSVTHRPRAGDGARHFGPYLGGQKARDAVSGLVRVLPPGHAADQAVGAERELTRARGASPDLACTVTAVLDRDPAAVAAARAELARRRDAAAATLAFEFAGRVQAELEALDWITADQMVTSAQPDDFDVHGWAGGMLVRFEIRGGRLTGWTQRACPNVVPPPGDGGPAWTGFARRAAELAALLAC